MLDCFAKLWYTVTKRSGIMDEQEKSMRELAEQLGKTYEELDLEMKCSVLAAIHGDAALIRAVKRAVCVPKKTGAG